MKEIIYELIEEAKDGKVNICDDDFEIGFNTIIVEKNIELFNENNLSTLVIKNEENFIELLEEYVNLEITKNRKIPNFYKDKQKNIIKWIVSFLFVNATPEDFKNIEEYIRKRIDFLNDQSFSYLENEQKIKMNGVLENTTLNIKKEVSPISMETPNIIKISLEDENNNRYNFPNIYYAIRKENNKNVCYIYSIKTAKTKEQSEEEKKFNKKINRVLFKLNDKVIEDEDYNLDGEANIKDVSMSFVLALNIFISLLQRENIEEIKAVPYQPLRYLSRQLTANESERREELEERNNNIQTNLTNKFIRTFRRLAHQNKDVEIVSYPYELDEYLTVSVSKRSKELENILLEETNKKVVESKTL